MGEIFEIYKTDIRNILKNWVALLILGGLIVMPSLYAWVNIRASWDPYSNTGGIKIDVVNSDFGTIFHEQELNVGNSVVEALRENKSMGWQFGKTRDEAMADLESGAVYAAIIIPSDFSQKIATVLDKNPQKPVIEYIENDKLNAIAPKITDKGASAIQESINKEFVAQVTDTVFQTLNNAGADLQKNYSEIILTRDALYELDKKFPELIQSTDDLLAKADGDSEKIQNLKQFIPLIQNSLGSVMVLTQNVSSTMGATQNHLKSTATMIGNNLDMMDQILQTTVLSSSELLDRLYSETGSSSDVIDKTIKNLTNAQTDLELLENLMQKVYDDVINTDKENEVKNLIDRLDALKKLLYLLQGDGLSVTDAQKTIEDILNMSDDLASEMRGANTALYEDVFPLLSLAISDMEALNDRLLNLFEQDKSLFLESIDAQIRRIEQQEDAIRAIIAVLEKAGSLKPLKLIDDLNGILNLLTLLKDGLTEMKSAADSDTLTTLIKQQERLLIDLKFSAMNAKTEMQNVLVPDMNSILQDVRALGLNLNDFVEEDGMVYLNDVVNGSIEGEQSIENMLESYRLLLEKLQGSAGDDLVNQAQNRVTAMLDSLEAYEQGLNELKASLENDSENVQLVLRQLHDLNKALADNVRRVKLDYNMLILPRLDTLVQNSLDLNANMEQLLHSVNGGLSDFYQILDDSYDTDQDLLSAVSAGRDKLPKVSEDVHALVGKIKDFDDNYDLESVISIFMNDITAEKDFISNPTEIKTTRLHEVPNYGSAMTPFYTVLSLWVGCLLLSSLLTTAVHGNYTQKQKFAGKFLLFLTMAICQALVVTLGDFLLLHCYAVDPPMVVALGVLCSIVFCCIVYTLVSVLGNIGKALGVVLLVLQVSASGGTFPVVLNPPFFQKINPFLPFTYAIDAMRQATAGVSMPALVKDVRTLLLFGITAFLIGFLLKSPLHTMTEGIQKKFEESGVGE